MAHPTDSLEAYALHLLSAEDEREVAGHLRTCAACQERLRIIEQALGQLAYLAPPVAPPPTAEDQLFARIADLRRAEQRAASSAALAPHVPSRVEDRHTSAMVPEALPPTPMPVASARHGPQRGTPAPASPSGHISRRERSQAAALFPRPASSLWFYALSLAAVVLLVAVGVLAANLSATRSANATLTAQVRAQQTILTMLSNPHTTVYHLSPTTSALAGATGTIILDPTSHKGMLLARNLPPLPSGKTYEFWLVQAVPGQSGAVTLPVGTFDVQNDGSGELVFTNSVPVSRLRNAGISIEPTGGVKTPDTPMLMLMSA